MAEGLAVDPRTGVPVITVRPRATTTKPQVKPEAPKGSGEEGSAYDLPEYSEPQAAAPQAGAAAPPSANDNSAYDLPAYVDTSVPQQPEPEVGAGQSALAGVRSGLTFGAAPALAGVAAAANAPDAGPISRGLGLVGSAIDKTNVLSQVSQLLGLPSAHDTVQGIARLIGDRSDAVKQAYDKGRQDALDEQDRAARQHPGTYYPGLIAGSLAVPLPGGAAAGATRAANALRMGVQGAALGTAQGIGEGVSRAEDPSQIAARAGVGAVTGFGTGGVLGAVLPRGAGAVLTPGQQAARTAADLGAPLPRGVVSDSPFVQSTTARLRQVPFAGERIGAAVHRTEEAAGGRVEDIAGQMTGGTRDRAAADLLMRPGLERAVQTNKGIANSLYNNVRARIDENLQVRMPETDRALTEIMRARAAAGYANPAEGLDQFRRVAGGATFAGAQRARADAREAGGLGVPHPGFNKADFNRLTQAMTEDLRRIVYTAAAGSAAHKQAAVRAFDEAERAFGPIAELNDRLNAMAGAKGEGSIATLLGAAKEKGGDLRLLAQLRHSMPAADFNHIGGQLLYELGHSAKTGDFSLAQFATRWEGISDRAKQIMFDPQHLRDIENIVGMGQHIKTALAESSSSHSANLLVAFEVLKELAAMAVELHTGGLGMGVAGALGGSGAVYTLTHWLANPVQARALSNWTRAYRTISLGQPSPARIAAFKLASRNLANNLNIPIERIAEAVQKHLPAAAQEPADNKGPKQPGPVQ